METPDFIYHRPTTLAEACELGRTLDDEVHFLAGGTDLFVDLKQKRKRARHVISLTGLTGLDDIAVDNGALRIGAMTRLSTISRSPEVQALYPALAEAVASIGSEQIRGQGTIGGNFCGAVPCADSPPICIAGEAVLDISDGASVRSLPAEDFISEPRVNALEAGEVVTAVVIPPQPSGSGASYQRFSLRHGSALAVASVAARLVIEKGMITDARVVLGAVAPFPLPTDRSAEAVIGQPPGETAFREAAKLAGAEARPICDIRGSDDFRREIVEVMTFRALSEAAVRAGEDRS